jgi:hypothetical protein
MVIRAMALPDYLDLPDLDAVFSLGSRRGRARLPLAVHGQQFSSFRRATRSKKLRDFRLRPRQTFLYTCGAIDLWEGELRLLDQPAGADGDDVPLCIGGRGAAPPEPCGGPTAYRLLRKRQQQGESMCTPAQVESWIGMDSASDPDRPPSSWDICGKPYTMVSRASIAAWKNTCPWSRTTSVRKRPTHAGRTRWSAGGSAQEIPSGRDWLR